MTRPTFGDTRPTFGYPPAVRDVREPERPSLGVQLGMDGTELHSMDAHDSTAGPHYGSWRTCPVCQPSWVRDDDERCQCDESGTEMPYQAGAWRE